MHSCPTQLLTSQTISATKMKNAATEGFSPAAHYLQGTGCRGQGSTFGGWVSSVRKQNKNRLCARRPAVVGIVYCTAGCWLPSHDAGEQQALDDAQRCSGDEAGQVVGPDAVCSVGGGRSKIISWQG